MAPLATKRRPTRCRRCGKDRKWHVCTAGGQQPPPAAAQGAGPDQGVDRISDLPDELLCAVVSLLPATDGARTMVLSRRWSNLWPSIPLDLDDGGEFGHPGDFLRVHKLITRVLSTHRGTVRRLRVGNFLHHTSTPDSWFRSPALDKLEELHFRFLFMNQTGQNPRNLLPSSALRFSELRVASYGRCEFPEDLGGTIAFPKLRELTLEASTSSESQTAPSMP